jgi:xylulokinase
VKGKFGLLSIQVKPVASAQSPKEEMEMIADQSGWAEQDPEMWWEHAIKSIQLCLESKSVQTQNQ